MKYKIGDKVRIATKKLIPEYWNGDGKMDKWMGKVMTINYIHEDSYQMQEDWGENSGRGWFWFEEMIDRLIDEHKIVITTDGKTTTAKLYDGKKFIKEAVAKCSPEDEFDFKTGAELAFKRLCGEEKEKAFFSEKAVYIRLGDFLNLTQGKIYNFTDGKYIDDVGNVLPCGYALYEEDLKAHGFLPIKE